MAQPTTKEEILKRVQTVVVEELGLKPDEVTPDASFAEDLGAESLDQVEIVMALEEEFELEISDEDAEKLQTIQQVVDYVAANL